MTTLPTENTAWGFWGTISRDDDFAGDPAQAWEHVMGAIAKATTMPESAVRDFLDSRDGRHFADDVGNDLAKGQGIEAAIDAAVERWMGWTIGRRIERELGIPRDLPYLTGFVAHAEIEAEMAAEAEA
jgi:hypothetical protein